MCVWGGAPVGTVVDYNTCYALDPRWIFFISKNVRAEAKEGCQVSRPLTFCLISLRQHLSLNPKLPISASVTNEVQGCSSKQVTGTHGHIRPWFFCFNRWDLGIQTQVPTLRHWAVLPTEPSLRPTKLHSSSGLGLQKHRTQSNLLSHQRLFSVTSSFVT